MADLSVVVYGRASTVGQIQPPFDVLSRSVTSEGLHLTETVTARLALLTVTASETLHVYADTVTRTWDGSGMTSFMASTGHATVIDYTARLRESGDSIVLASENLFKPTPDGNFVITVDLSALFAYRAAGDYTVSILARDAGGSTDSEESLPFTLPLPWWPVERVAVGDTVTVVRV